MYEGRSIYVAMQPRDTVGRLYSHIEEVKGPACDASVLSHNGQYLQCRQTMAAIDHQAWVCCSSSPDCLQTAGPAGCA